MCEAMVFRFEIRQETPFTSLVANSYSRGWKFGVDTCILGENSVISI